MKLVKGDITGNVLTQYASCYPKPWHGKWQLKQNHCWGLRRRGARELRSKAPQHPGAVLMSPPWLLSIKNIIHMVVGSWNKQYLQTCVEDSASFDSLSIPAVGSGGLGLSPEDSAEVVFEEIVACVPQRAFPIRSWGESCGLWLFQIWCIPERVGLKVQKQNAHLSYSEDNEGVADAAYEDEALEAPADELSWCCRRQKVIVHGRTESFDAVIAAMKDGVTKACKDPRIIKHEVIKGLPKQCIGDLKRMRRARDVKLHRSEADTIRLWKDFLKMWWT